MSSNILYQQEKSQNEFLSLINACVSHELRNPLNSIIAQNIEKNFLYDKIKSQLDAVTPSNKDEVIENVKTQMEKLKKGLKVQESSASIMGFIV